MAVTAVHPEYGERRITDILKRFSLMRTSPATVHTTLSARGLVKKRPVKAEKNPAKPRFFERARPNQIWQSDILTVRLGGQNAYLIGFIDDYSRYITTLGLGAPSSYVQTSADCGLYEIYVQPARQRPPRVGGEGAAELACRLESLSPKIDDKGERILDAKLEAEFS